MMMFKPTIRLDRLYIARNGSAAYDETFHDGINIIRGNNGSGKSTIAEFIRYALGGSIVVWKKEASLCDFVVAQVSLNNIPVCFKRDVSDQRSRPMSIFWGPFEDAMKDVAKWEVYPYLRGAEKQSFSQVIFGALELPEVRGEYGDNITLHQLSRLFYVDQRTSFTQIFADDGNFDSHDKRSAVADYMCGIFIDDLYNSKIHKKSYEDEHNALRIERTGISKILANSNLALSKEAFEAEINNTQILFDQKKVELEELMSNKWDKSKIDSEIKKEIKTLEKDITGTRNKLTKSKNEIERIEYEILDSDNFLEHLEESYIAIEQSDTVGEHIGIAKFEHCPSCYNPVNNHNADSKCSLCGCTVDIKKIAARNLRMKSELKFQIKESESLQQQRSNELASLKEDYGAAKKNLANLEKRYSVLRLDLVSGSEQAIGKISQEIGYYERKLEEFNNQRKLADRISLIDKRMEEIAGEIEKLNTKISSYQLTQEKTRTKIYTAISDYTVDLLHKDLEREDTFKNAQSISFDFREGKIFTVIDQFSDGKPREFSASSMVLLKNAFHLALHLASLDLSYVRYPRFTLFDDIEDKGMEEARSHNFQKLIVESLASKDVQNQIIFTTSMVAPELDMPEYTVGEFYTKKNKTLKGFASSTQE